MKPDERRAVAYLYSLLLAVLVVIIIYALVAKSQGIQVDELIAHTNLAVALWINHSTNDAVMNTVLLMKRAVFAGVVTFVAAFLVIDNWPTIKVKIWG